MITTDQAIEMYARFCKARFGADAKRIADARALSSAMPATMKCARGLARAVTQSKIEARALN
jgi:hypothetical protein